MTTGEPGEKLTTPMELLPCPFCGSRDITASNVGEEEDNWYVGCMASDCQVNPSVFNPESEVDAIAAWNRRAQPSQPAERLREARQIVCEEWQAFARVKGVSAEAMIAVILNRIDALSHTSEAGE